MPRTNKSKYILTDNPPTILVERESIVGDFCFAPSILHLRFAIRKLLAGEKAFGWRKTQIQKKASLITERCPIGSWDTRIRTRNDRTRICSVTITPYPNIAIMKLRFHKCGCKGTSFFSNHQIFLPLFSDTSLFSSKKTQILAFLSDISCICRIFA